MDSEAPTHSRANVYVILYLNEKQKKKQLEENAR
jgi:hypothetical protein